jgi:predicted GNAT superfamily acetyltransferase
VIIRDLESPADLDACVALQQAIWGGDFSECVPRSMLIVARKMGGVVAGAFDGERLVGFVFGLTGLRDGRLAHWSDMLAVDPSRRDQGIGRQLKAFQREMVMAMGVSEMYWTYDPLVARNAHLNLNTLGAEVVEYVPDMYGTTSSPLHGNVPTDRFVVRWRLDGTRPAGWAPRRDDRRVEIPSALEGADLARWRASTRGAIMRGMAEGYRVAGFCREGETAFYTLTREGRARDGRARDGNAG